MTRYIIVSALQITSKPKLYSGKKSISCKIQSDVCNDQLSVAEVIMKLRIPAILQVHLLFTNPNPVLRSQLFPLQYWQNELHVKGVAVHWPLRHVSPRVHLSPSSHATPSRDDHVLVLFPGSHHFKREQY